MVSLAIDSLQREERAAVDQAALSIGKSPTMDLPICSQAKCITRCGSICRDESEELGGFSLTESSSRNDFRDTGLVMRR